MATVYVGEAPGGTMEIWECPYCSKSYPMVNVENGETLECPDTCRRCGSPMDVEKSIVFANAMAEKAAKATGQFKRPTVKV